MESILNWTWPHEETFRFYLVQFFFWGGYFFLTGLVGTFPYRFAKYNYTAWTTFVLGAMGTLMAYLSQFLFKLAEPLDMVSPYAVIVATIATAVLSPLVSVFAFVCRETYDYDDDLDDRPIRDYDERRNYRDGDRDYDERRSYRDAERDYDVDHGYNGERNYNNGGSPDANSQGKSRQNGRRRRSFR